MTQSPRHPRAAIPSFEAKLESEEEVLDALLAALSKSQLDPSIWNDLHQAAVRDDRVSELAFAYESLAQGRKLKTQLPVIQAELFYRAATFFGDVLGDEFGATTYLEKALGAHPAHVGAFSRIDAQLTRTDDNKKLAELCVQTAPHRPRPDQIVLLKRAAVLFERANLDDKAIETYQQIVKLDASDEAMRNALEARYVKASRYRDVARMFEQALAADPPPEGDEAARIRAKLTDVFANQLKEPERAMPHVEALLEHEPTHAEARRVATRLLESKGLAARAAAALAAGAPTTEERARCLAIELENTRGPRRRDVLRRVGVLKQDELGDMQGALEAFEQALGIDPGDDELRRRYLALGVQLKGPLEVARTFARVSTVAKDAAVRSKITAEMGELLLRGGDAKRARTTLAGVLQAHTADPAAVLVAARALAGVYDDERDLKSLLEVLTRIGELATDPNERQATNERVADIAAELGDTDRAIAAYRRLVDSPARGKALAALEPLYEQRCEWLDLSFVLEQRAKGLADRAGARALSFRAAEVLTAKARDMASASEAWRLMTETYGAARDVYEQWIPILEGQKQWPELATALANDAGLVSAEERPAILARLGNVQLARVRDTSAAIDAFREALAIDPHEKTSRAVLEKLLGAGEHRLEAAEVLEPVYRVEDNAQGLLRVLDIEAQLSPVVADRLAALEEAADVAASVSRDKAVEIVARGLAEAVESQEALAPWLDRFDRNAEGLDGKRRASLLGKALGDRPIDSPGLSALARRVGEEHAACGDVAAALAAFRRALAYEPTSPELMGRVDELLQEQGNPEERVTLYRGALERGAHPARRRKLLHSIGAIERYELLAPDNAIAAYKAALADDAADHEAHNALVELYTETERWNDMCGLLEDHLSEASTQEEIRRTRAHLAEVAATHGQPDRAAAHAGALLGAAQLGAAELDLVERVADELGDANLLRATLERRVTEAADPRQQAQCLERLADLAKAAGDDTRAADKLRQGAEIAKVTGDEPTAIHLYVRILRIDPRNADATRALVELYEHADQFATVPELYAVLLELATDKADKIQLYRALSRTLADKLDDLPRAFAACREAFALVPDDREVLHELEVLAIRTRATQDFGDAIVDAVAATLESPQNIWTDLTLSKARVMATSEETRSDAAAAFRAVLQRSADEAQLSAASEGLEALLRATPAGPAKTADARWLHSWRVDHAPPDARAAELSAWATVEEKELGEPTAALALYRRVLEIDDRDGEALSAVSRLSLALGDVDGALAALAARRAVSEGEARGALEVEIAGILAQAPGRAGEALERIGEVLESSPHHQGALELAARLLRDDEVAGRAAAVLERSLDAVDDPEVKIEILRRLIERSEPRLDRYERLLDLLAEHERHAEAFEVVLRAAGVLPSEQKLWDRAESIARQLSSPDALATLYERVLRADMPREHAIELGQRAVAFYEEWFEDGGRVVGILERLLEIEPRDTWAFDRLKLIFDAQERWDDLFALYDRVAKAADRDRRMELLEEAAQIAKDFANHSARAIGYLEQLLELKPSNARLSSSLERLYERHGCHRELITLLAGRLPSLSHDDAQKERARIAALWLDELGDAASALLVVEDIITSQPEPAGVDEVDLLERVLAAAPAAAEVRDSLPPPGDSGRRDSSGPGGKRGLVRQRAAALLKERYSAPGREVDLARVLEVELEVVRSVKERIRRHQQIAGIYAQLGNDERAMEHLVQLVLLEPEVKVHRDELAAITERTGRFGRLADVLVAAADDCNEDALRVELLMHAGGVTAQNIGDRGRAIELFFRILSISPIADAALLAACRHVEPLLEQAERAADRLDVLERLAILEEEPEVRWRVLGNAARLAMELGEDDRAIWAWEGRLETRPDDPEALDGLIVLFDKAERWRQLIEALVKRARLDRLEADRRADRVRVAGIQSGKLSAIEDAVDTWQDIEQTFGESDDGTRALGELYRTTRRWDELGALLARAAERASAPAAKAEVLRELGDLQREQLDAAAGAIASYEASLAEVPRNEGSRAGLQSLLKRPESRAEVVRVLLTAYHAADDWKLVLDLTEHRLAAAKDTPARIAVLMESADIAEQRAQDLDAAFALVRRALLLDAGQPRTAEELFRLAEATRSWRSLADALRECLDAHEEEPPWARALRFRMGGVLETRLDDPRAALDAYVLVAQGAPGDLDAARAVIRVAGRTMRWDAAARALVEATRARGRLEPTLVSAVEEAAGPSSGWDAITFAAASLVHDGGGLSDALARDVEAIIAVWHRDRRGDPDAAETAYARALSHDATNVDILAALAKLQRRARGRPLVDSLLRLSQATGGDLDLLTEAADVALGSVGDRALAKSILERLLRLASDRWLGATEPAISSGSPAAPETYVERATRELVRILGDDGDHERVVGLLVETSALPLPIDKARALRHEAARVAVDRQQAHDRAVGIYLGLIDEDPHDAEAVSRLEHLYVTGSRTGELLALKRRLVGAAKTQDERLALRVEIAALEDSISQVGRAIAALEENLAEAQRHARTVKELATLLSREREWPELEALWAKQAVIAEQSGEPKAAADLHQLAAAVAEKKLGDVPGAIGHLRRIVEIEPRNAALDDLARLSTEVRDHDAAAGYLDRLRQQAPEGEHADVTLRLADALVAAGRKGDAQQRLEEEISGDPEADRVRMRLADVYRHGEAWVSLAKLLSDGATHAPDKATRLSRLREAAELHRVRTGQPARAIPLLEQASDLSPEDNAVKLALADALGGASRFEEARTLLRTLVDAFGLRRPKERAPVHYHLALLDLAVGDRARALVELDAATRIDPANPEILRVLAELARDDRQLDRAERSYRALLTVLRRQEETPEEAPITRSEVMFELSQIALRQGETDRAKEILESAFELCAESLVEARRLEAALRRAGDNANLARALEARLARGGAPDGAGIYSDLGRIYEEHLGRAEDALAMRLRALDLDPRSDETHEAAMRLASELGKISVYEQRVRALAGRASGESPERDHDLAGALFVRLAKIAESERKDDREAAALYERAVDAIPRDRGVLAALDRVYERLGEAAGQARVLGMRVDLDAQQGGASADALYRLAQLRFRTGDVDAACAAFEEAFTADSDAERAEELLKSAADAHPKSERVVAIYERLSRAPGRERSLVDALVRKWGLPGAGTDPMREAVEIAQGLGGELAESLLRRWLEAGHDDQAGRVWALSLLAKICEESERVREAVVLKREAAEIAEPGEARRLLFDVAKLASGSLDDLHLAASIYEELHERDPADCEAWQPLLDVYRRMFDHEKLSGLIAEVVDYVDEPHDRSKLRLERVRIAMDKLNLSDDDAAAELREIVDEDPTATNAAILLGTILERTGREDDLAELLAKQLDAAKDRQDSEAVSSLSRRLGQLLERRDVQQARDVYVAALDWDPNAREILLALERVHEAADDKDARADVMERRLALETGADAERLAVSLADLRRAHDDAGGALRALEIGFKASPTSHQLRDELEAVYRDQLEYDRLAELYVTDARGRADPGEKAARLREAARMYRDDLSDPERGAMIMREAREAAPSDDSLLDDLVEMLAAGGELRAAAEELSAAVDARPEGDLGRVQLVGRRGLLRARLGDAAGALADLEAAIEGGQLDLRGALTEHLDKMALQAAGRGEVAQWKAHRLRIAELHLEMGDIEDARNVLTELLKTDSKDRGTLRAIAHVDELEERWDAASATYRRLVGLEDGEGIVSAALKLAETCEKAGRLADARGGLERARMAAPDNKGLRDRLAWLYERLGAVKDLAELVLEEARAAGDVAPRFEGLMRAGQLFLELSQDPQSTQQMGVAAAIGPLEEAHALRPADLDCAALLSDAYVGGGRFEEGQDLLQRTIGTFKGRRARELSALYHRLARIAEIVGNRTQELQHLTTALDMDAQNGIVASELAYLAMELGNWDVAQRALRVVTMLKTPAPLPRALAYQHLGEIARRQGDTKRALMLLKRAIDDDPTLASARSLLDALQAEG